MKFNYSTLRSILKSENYNFHGEEFFSFLNIAKPSGDLLAEVDTTNELFFTVYENDYAKEGWYDNNFDRRQYIDNVMSHRPDLAVITDSRQIVERYKNSRKIMYVPSLPHAINKLYTYTLHNVRPKVAAITGSVGKTTSICLLEDILATEHNVLRLYSKRITPLNLRSMVVNFLEPKHDFIALEMSMNRKDHVKKLAEMLPPDHAGILNITNAHIGSQDIHSQDDIWEAKSAIFNNIASPVLNLDYPAINRHKSELNNVLTFGLNAENNPDLLGKIDNNRLKVTYQGRKLFESSPYLLTELSIYQVLATTALGLQAGIAPENIRLAVNNFTPKEHRLISYNNHGNKIIFDGDITFSARLKELANNYYDYSTLIVSNLYSHNGNDTPENIAIQKRELAEVFAGFDKVLVADNIKDAILDDKVQKYQTFAPQELPNIIKEQKGTYFIHHSVYFRNHVPERMNGSFAELQKVLGKLGNNQNTNLHNLALHRGVSR